MQTAAFLAALICAGLMGFAIQSGATCTVYAVSELIEQRRAARLVAMLEAGLWVAALLTLFGLAAMMLPRPPAYAPGWSTLAGGILLGLGASLNGACLFGTVARIGSGEWGYAATPLGYLAGVMLFGSLHASEPRLAAQGAAPGSLFVIVVVALALGSLFRTGLRRSGRRRVAPPVAAPSAWDPHEATLVIGATFAVLMACVGHWTYSDLLGDLAHGQATGVTWRLALFAALLGGARLAGWRHGRTAWVRPGAGRIMACLGGGALMGLGGALIPGGNDGLVLVGLPFLLPYALLALAAMVVTVALAISGQRLWTLRQAAAGQCQG